MNVNQVEQKQSSHVQQQAKLQSAQHTIQQLTTTSNKAFAELLNCFSTPTYTTANSAAAYEQIIALINTLRQQLTDADVLHLPLTAHSGDVQALIDELRRATAVCTDDVTRITAVHAKQVSAQLQQLLHTTTDNLTATKHAPK